jgi:transcriptional regulator with PAS, ATPase and Fis domain
MAYPLINISLLTLKANILKNQLEILLAKYGKSTQSKKLIAQELGISLATLYRWLKKYRIR